MAASKFVFNGFQPPGGVDPFGVWALAGEEPARTLSAFAAVETGGLDVDKVGLVWYTELPAAAKEARPALRSRLATLADREHELSTVAQRLAQFDPSLAYGIKSPGPEAHLLASIAGLRSPLTAYETRLESAEAHTEIYADCQKLLAQFRRLIQESARIETRVGMLDVALTAVDWTGDYQTTWRNGVTATDMALHLDAVRLALASRRALIRLMVVVATGALELAMKAAVPGGQFLLIPAVYDYVRDILAELDRIPAARPAN